MWLNFKIRLNEPIELAREWNLNLTMNNLWARLNVDDKELFQDYNSIYKVT